LIPLNSIYFIEMSCNSELKATISWPVFTQQWSQNYLNFNNGMIFSHNVDASFIKLRLWCQQPKVIFTSHFSCGIDVDVRMLSFLDSSSNPQQSNVFCTFCLMSDPTVFQPCKQNPFLWNMGAAFVSYIKLSLLYTWSSIYIQTLQL
jgi:hypothetical protein